MTNPDESKELIKAAETVFVNESLQRSDFLIEIAKVATDLVPIGTAFLAGVASGNYGMISAAFLGGGVLGLKIAMERVKARKRQPDIEKHGPGLALEIATKAAGKSGFMRDVWIGLLSNAIDPDFPHEIRKSDLAILDTLNDSDVVIILMVGKYLPKMHDDWSSYPNAMQLLEHLGVSADYNNTEFFNLRALRNQFNKVIKSELRISNEELSYSIEEKSRPLHDSSNDGEYLFECVVKYQNKSLWKHNTSITKDISDYPTAHSLYILRLLPKTRRILNLIYDQQLGY